MSDWPNRCPERDAIENGPLDPGDEPDDSLPHCFHDLPEGHEHGPACVCCFCGDVFESSVEHPKKHGPYATGKYQETINLKKTDQKAVTSTKKRSSQGGQRKRT